MPSPDPSAPDPQAPDPKTQSGRRIGPFALEGELGRGAMGAVFRARGPDGATVALKLLTRPGASPRLEREARALLRLRHPHLVRLLGAGAGPPPWVAMELIEGESLEALLRREGALPPARAARIVGQAAQGIAEVHAQGLLHRDVKAANVLLRRSDGSAVVGDFGLAVDLDEDQRLTRSGALLGTPSNMSPEQLQADRAQVGPASDVWGLGTVLYRCLTGSEPFPHHDLFELMATVQSGKVNPPRALNPDIPPWLEGVCLQCLRTDPAARPGAAELAERLLGPPARARRRNLLLLALIGLCALLVGGLAALLATPPPPAGAPPALHELALQPGSFAGQDTYVQSVGLYADDGFGADPTLFVGERSYRRQAGDARAFLRFDLRGVPAGAEVRAARLELWLVDVSLVEPPPTRPLRVRAQRVAGPWEEGSSGQDEWLDGIAWASANPLRVQPEVLPGPPLCEVEVAGHEHRVSFELTSAVQAWLADPAHNFGVRLAQAEEGPPFELGVAMFVSSDHPQAEHRPRLVIEYAGPPPPADPWAITRAEAVRDRRLARQLLDTVVAEESAVLIPTLEKVNEAARRAPDWSRPFLFRADLLRAANQRFLALLDLGRAVDRELEPEDEDAALRMTKVLGAELEVPTHLERLSGVARTLLERGLGGDDRELRSLAGR